MQQTLSNRTPTATPVQLVQAGSGVVTGTIGAVDPDGDPIIYTLVDQPAHGSVALARDGSYTYFPGEELAATGGMDTFTTRIADRGFHLHLGNGNGTVTVEVPVTVLPNTAPTVTAAPSVGQPDATTGAVSGDLAVDDAENHPLFYEIVTAPAYGTVEFADGGYVYVPTQAARLQAAESGGAVTDGFTVSVTDAASEPVAVAVSGLVIAPGAAQTDTPVSVGDFPVGLVLSPDGTRVYTVNSNDDTLSIVDSSSGAAIGDPIAVGDAPFGLTLNNDGTRAYVVNSTDGTVSVVDTFNRRVLGPPIRVGNSPTDAALTPDGRQLYVTNTNDGSVTVIDTVTRRTIAQILVGSSPFGVAISRDGTRAYVTNEGEDTVSVISTASQAVLSTIDVGNAPTDIAITADGTRAMSPTVGRRRSAATDQYRSSTQRPTPCRPP